MQNGKREKRVELLGHVPPREEKLYLFGNREDLVEVAERVAVSNNEREQLADAAAGPVPEVAAGTVGTEVNQ